MRKPTKTYLPDEFEEEHKASLNARYAEITAEGKTLHKLLLESNRVLKVSKGAPPWRAYVEFINDIAIDGLARAVAFSLETLNAQLDPAALARDEAAPFVEVQLEPLPEPSRAFPSLPRAFRNLPEPSQGPCLFSPSPTLLALPLALPLALRR